MATSETSFVELVRKSGLLDETKLQDRLTRWGDQLPPDPPAVAALFVREGLLTPFQANSLLKGKYRGFVLRGKYKLLDLLGAGGMGQVFLCEHILLKRLVAVKVLPPGKVNDRSLVERFFREARAVAALDHPNIVRVYDVEQDDKMPLMVMEYVDGANLDVILRKRGQLSIERACHYVAQAALGLQHAHEAGLVHRDIKPGNLLVDRTGTVKILDLGLARFFHDTQDQLTANFDDKSVLGTADYLAPEQAMSSTSVDIRADIYSLGTTFYALLAGDPPFAEGTVPQKLVWHQLKEPTPIRERRPDLPAGLAQVIERMMAKDPKNRWSEPVEVAQALAPWTNHAVPPPPTDEMPQLSLATSGLTNLRLSGPNSMTSMGASTSTSLAQSRLQQMTARMTPPGLAGSGIHLPRSRGWMPWLIGGLGLLVLGGVMAAWWAWSGPAPIKAPVVAVKPATQAEPSAGPTEIVPGVVSIVNVDRMVGQICTVEFQVNGTGISPSGLMFLNSHPDYQSRDTFTVVIYPEAGKVLGITGRDDLKSRYDGKTVQVRGKVELYKAKDQPQIKVEKPEQIVSVR